MKISSEVFSFEGVVERFEGKGAYYYVAFPYPVEEIYGTKGRVRVLGKVNDTPIDRALIPDGKGGHYIIFGGELRRQAKIKLGDRVKIEVKQNETPDEIALPEELQAALNLETNARRLYENLNPGMRRNICYWIQSAKRPETRAQRGAEVLRRLLSGEFHFGGKTIEN